MYTGKTRLGNEFLSSQVKKTIENDHKMMSELDWVKESVNKVFDFLISSDFESYGNFLHEYWKKKRERNLRMSNSEIDSIYLQATSHGAIGGKLVGAGGSGFLMFITSDKEQLRAVIDPRGEKEVPFSFDHQGFNVLSQN